MVRPAGRLLLARLDAFDEAGGSDWLTPQEAARLQAMTAPGRRRSFLAGHWLARELAAGWLQADVARIGLGQHADGRPVLHVDGEPSGLSLSLSHSGDWVAAAIASVPLGVDIELPRRARDLHALARFTFSSDEVARLDGLEDGDRHAVFQRLWTLKEARGKRTGEGILRGQSRRVSTVPSDVESAEATSWVFGAGALALAIEPGARMEIVGGEGLASPTWWRYREDG